MSMWHAAFVIEWNENHFYFFFFFSFTFFFDYKIQKMSSSSSVHAGEMCSCLSFFFIFFCCPWISLDYEWSNVAWRKYITQCRYVLCSCIAAVSVCIANGMHFAKTNRMVSCFKRDPYFCIRLPRHYHYFYALVKVKCAAVFFASDARELQKLRHQS